MSNILNNYDLLDARVYAKDYTTAIANGINLTKEKQKIFEHVIFSTLKAIKEGCDIESCKIMLTSIIEGLDINIDVYGVYLAISKYINPMYHY